LRTSTPGRRPGTSAGRRGPSSRSPTASPARSSTLGQPGWPDLRTKYESALEEFNRRNFRTAAGILGNLLAEQQDDGPSLVLLSRAVRSLVEGPDEVHPVWGLPGK
jgi:hypothetical protein